MDTPERIDRSLPSPWPATSPPPPPMPAGLGWEEPIDAEPPAAKKAVTSRTVLRAVRRHWWQILLAWIVLSAGLVALAYYNGQKIYEATAWLKIEAVNPIALGPSVLGGADPAMFMETQVRLVTSPDVLKQVVLNPEIANKPLFRDSDNPENELRERLTAMIPPKTNLVLISLSTPHQNESADIVNAVVRTYLDKSKGWMDNDSDRRLNDLKALEKKFGEEQTKKRKLLQDLSQEGVSADPDGSTQRSVEEYRAYSSRYTAIQLELIDAYAVLKSLRAARQLAGDAQPDRPGGEMGPEELDRAVRRAFLADREVAMLHEQLAAAEQRLGHARRLAHSESDPVIQRYRKEVAELKHQNEQLWSRKQALLREEALTAAPTDPILTDLRAIELKKKKLEEERAAVETKLEVLRPRSHSESNNALLAQFTSEDLNYVNAMFTRVSQMREQLEQDKNGELKITKLVEARESGAPVRDTRKMMMAAAPVGALMAVLGLFVLVEIRGARVSDPEELSDRLRVGVLGVVPPLPSLRPPKGAKALRDQRRRIEEFVQSLDHLRVALCSARGTPGGHRCVLITSACGGEGKTTLAAQLAGRCANAGLTTLLIDADLRRPSLGELLEVPEGPGLAEVLLGEAEPEEATVVVGNAGGFHLLPAGAGGHDPSRLLQGERLGQLIARFREAFDMVLIDAPPVLAVPDALLLGRWADGAVVAVRHDSSRYPLVERAYKRLATVGVSVLGAVVNGARPPESAYGAYGYYVSNDQGRAART